MLNICLSAPAKHGVTRVIGAQWRQCRRTEEEREAGEERSECYREADTEQMGETEDERTAQACQLFENFVQASTCKGTLQAFSILCRQLELDPLDHSNFFNSLKAAVSTWKVKALWTKLDKRTQHKVYDQNKACQGTRVSRTNWEQCVFQAADT